MAYAYINSEDRLLQNTFAEHLRDKLGWESVYVWNEETFGPDGTLDQAERHEVLLTRRMSVAIPLQSVNAAQVGQFVQEFHQLVNAGGGVLPFGEFLAHVIPIPFKLPGKFHGGVLD